MCPRLNGVDAGLSGPDPDRFLDVRDENLAVPDPSGLCRAPDRLHGFFNHVVAEDNFDLHFGKEIHDVLGTPIELGVPLLAAESFGLGDGDALQANLLQRLLHLVELEWLDDRLELLHRVSCPPGPRGNALAAAPTVSRVHAKAVGRAKAVCFERVLPAAKAVCRALLLAFDERIGNRPISQATAATHSQY